MSGDWDAPRYDRIADPQTRWGAAVLERLDLAGDETVLDAGCGTGRVTEQLLARLPLGRVVALDASRSMLDQAEHRLAGPRVRLLHADLLELDPARLGDAHPLDAVFSTATFHWVLDHDRLFANLAGVLRPGGQLVAQCGAEGNTARLLAAVRALGRPRAGTWCYATAAETTQRLERSGFRVERVWTHEEPTRFDEGEPFLEFLETVCLRQHLGTLPEAERRTFVERVATQVGEPVIDYVRLNIVARRDSGRRP